MVTEGADSHAPSQNALYGAFVEVDGLNDEGCWWGASTISNKQISSLSLCEGTKSGEVHIYDST